MPCEYTHTPGMRWMQRFCAGFASLSLAPAFSLSLAPGSQTRVKGYKIAKMHKMPCLYRSFYRSFPGKEPYNYSVVARLQKETCNSRHPMNFCFQCEGFVGRWKCDRSFSSKEHKLLAILHKETCNLWHPIYLFPPVVDRTLQAVVRWTDRIVRYDTTPGNTHTSIRVYVYEYIIHVYMCACISVCVCM